MASTVLTNAFAYVSGFDFTGDANKLQVSATAEKKIKTNFRSAGWEESVKGIRTMNFELAGYTGFAATEADVAQFNAFSAADVSQVGTCGPAETEGELAWMSASGVYDYAAYDALGELSPMKLTATGRDAYGLVRGVLLKKLGSVSATGATGTAVQVGAVGTGQYLYGSFHVFTAGTTITAVVESAAANTFSGATTRLTVGPLTAAGGTWATRVASPITDTWWRVRVTTITGTFSVACAIGIQ